MTTDAEKAVREAADKLWKREGGTARGARLMNKFQAAAEWRALEEASPHDEEEYEDCVSRLCEMRDTARKKYMELK